MISEELMWLTSRFCLDTIVSGTTGHFPSYSAESRSATECRIRVERQGHPNWQFSRRPQRAAQSSAPSGWSGEGRQGQDFFWTLEEIYDRRQAGIKLA